MSLTPEQARAVRASGSAAVTAGAGTGKTHMLTERYLHHVVAQGLRPLEIVAATFTERAAGELRSRVRRRLLELPQAASLAPELEAAQIGTLHSLAGRICREHPDAAGVPHDFAVQDELEQRLWFVRQFGDALKQLGPAVSRELPFAQLVATLRVLCDDPFTAERALAVDPADWERTIEEERQQAMSRLTARADWAAAVAVLREVRGPEGDKLELQRRAALQAVDAIASGNREPAVCRPLGSLDLRGGSKKRWGADALDTAKAACLALREAYREEQAILELRLGEADEALARALPVVRQAYARVVEQLRASKLAERVLDFNDLELHALRALESDPVRDFYRRRWKAFLIDEFQDTNPVQAELLARLTADARVTVVGDEKQSIYGFRRADVGVFRQVQRSIAEAGGVTVTLETSFRTHGDLLEPINRAIAPALGDLHQQLTAARTRPPGDGPYLGVRVVSDGPALKQFRQRAEADHVGELIASLLEEGAPVSDPASGESRPVRPGDIAILSRRWGTLEAYGDELAARGIPIIHAGGGHLLDQREAMDATALLRFLADPADDLALATVLRSPFFAFDDAALLGIAERSRTAGSWWSVLSRPRVDGDHTTVGAPAREALMALLESRQVLPPSRLLALADDLTGYTAVVANLPGGPRRLADWRGFVEFVTQLESGHADVFAVVRELEMLAGLPGVKIARPGMEAGDAVTLMSVHNGKGLEWPIVLLPDVTGRSRGGGSGVLFEAGIGLAFRVRDVNDDEAEPALYRILARRAKAREAAEEARVLYVALTRARDRLILTGSSDEGGWLASLLPGLEEAGVDVVRVPFEAERAVPKTPVSDRIDAPEEALLAPLGPGLTELPASSIGTYRECPKRFHYANVARHPGAGEQIRLAGRTGTLAHKALERGLTAVEELRLFEPTLAREHLQQALDLAASFRQGAAFAELRDGIEERERRVSVEYDGILLHGVADAVGRDFVLDYKTGSRESETAHLLQIAIYAGALEREKAHLAYLGADGGLSSYTASELEAARAEVRELLRAMSRNDFQAAPAPRKCGRCPFAPICGDSLAPRN